MIPIPQTQTQTQTYRQTFARKALLLLFSGLLLLGGLLLSGCVRQGEASDAANQAQEAAQPAFEQPTAGTPIEPPRPVQDFTLTNQDGQPVSLSDLRGKPVLLYFGYTFCPDICPTTLADLTRARYNMGEQADQVHFVMVSVDPERDTPEVLKTYLANFDENFIGLQGQHDVLTRIGPDYGLFYQKREIEGTSAAYLIDHTAATYLIDEQGRLMMIYGYGIPAEVVSSDLLEYLQTGTISS